MAIDRSEARASLQYVKVMLAEPILRCLEALDVVEAAEAATSVAQADLVRVTAAIADHQAVLDTYPPKIAEAAARMESALLDADAAVAIRVKAEAEARDRMAQLARENHDRIKEREIEDAAAAARWTAAEASQRAAHEARLAEMARVTAGVARRDQDAHQKRVEAMEAEIVALGATRDALLAEIAAHKQRVGAL